MLTLVFWLQVPQANYGKLLKNPAPEVNFELPKGVKKKLSDYRGSVVFLNFWASWCDPCIVEMPDISELEERYADRDFVVLALNVEHESRAVVEKLKITMPKNLIFEFDDEVLDAYQVSGIPVTILVGRGGEVRKIYLGPRNWLGKAIIRELEGVLNGGLTNKP